MALPQSKVTKQGQISVPAEVRRKLGIGPGSVLEWEQDGEQVVVRKAGRFSSAEVHAAIFPKKPAPRKLDDLKRAIRRQAKAKHESR